MIEVDLQRLKRGWLRRAGQLRFVIEADFDSLPVAVQPDVEFYADPVTLAAARRDFGRMILTPDDLIDDLIDVARGGL